MMGLSDDGPAGSASGAGNGAAENFREGLGDGLEDIGDIHRPPQFLGNRRYRHIPDTTRDDGLEVGKIGRHV